MLRLDDIFTPLALAGALTFVCAVPPGALAAPNAAPAAAKAAPTALFPALARYADSLPAGFDALPADRKKQLDKLALYIKSRRSAGEPARLVYICTHNSRRSHMGQLFASLAAAYYGIEGVETFSGGTEVTAFNPRAVAALSRAGFVITPSGSDNPRYRVAFSAGRPAVVAFSKVYDDPANPKRDFAAIMTCSHADKTCPMVAGASLRVPLHYEDPKVSDGTPEEAAVYDGRARQIATEAFYLFSRLRS